MPVTCCICHSPDKVLLEVSKLHLYRCGACGHVFKNIHVEDQEKYGEEYFSEEHKNWFNNPDYKLFEFIHRYIAQQKDDKRVKVLDMGCGNGNLLKYLKEKNPKLELYGIDITENKYPGIHFIKGDILKYNFDMKFDVICNITLIEHLDNPSAFIKRVKDMLSPDGVLVTVTDDDNSMIYSVARFLKRLGIGAAYDRLYCKHHLHCFSRASLRTLMESNGLDVILNRKHNHPVAAVDYPKSNFFSNLVFRIAVHSIFMLAAFFNRGILQTAICKKRT